MLFLGVLLVSCMREAPDRTPAVQGPLILFVLAAPALSHALRRRDRSVRVSVLALQVLAYLVYETGVSVETNIRTDLPLIYSSIALNAWIVFRSAAQVEPTRPKRPTWATVVGVLGVLFAVAGILGALYFFAYPSLIQRGRTWVEGIDVSEMKQVGVSSEMKKTMHDRLVVPSWFTPYCLVMGLAGLIASGAYLWGALRLLQLKRSGPTLFVRGAVSYTLVSAGIATAGLVSSSAAIREHLFLALGSLMINVVLVFVVLTRDAKSNAA